MRSTSPEQSARHAITAGFLWALLASCVSSGGLLDDQMRIQAQAGGREDRTSSADAKARKATEEGAGEHGETGPGLEVRGSPRGAAVFLDGEYAGISPVALPLNPGFHEIRIEAEGYREFSDGFFHAGTETRLVEYDLPRLCGILDIVLSPADAELELSGLGLLGSGRHEVPVGEQGITVRRFGYETVRRSVTIREDEVAFVDVSLVQAPLKLQPTIRYREFNPRDAGSLGRIRLAALPNSYGYASIRILDREGITLAECLSPFISSPDIIELEWDGRDGSGAIVPEGEYRVVFESWSRTEACEQGGRPEGEADAKTEERIRVGRVTAEYGLMLSLLSGSSYCPSGTVMTEALQFSLSAQGTFVSGERWLGQLTLSGRTDIDTGMEGDSTVGLVFYPGMAPRFVLGLGLKGRLWEAERGSLRSAAALYGKANLFTEGIAIDPFGAMRGLSLGLPLRFGWGILDLDFCPEICWSPYLPNRAESVYADIFAAPWHFIPYLRGAIRLGLGEFDARLSGFSRFYRAPNGTFLPDPPYGLALDCLFTDRARGIRYGVSALGQIRDVDDYYFLLGLECGILFRPRN